MIQTKQEWLNTQCDEEVEFRQDFAGIPDYFVVINSETIDPAEQKVWDALARYFGDKIYVTTYAPDKTGKRDDINTAVKLIKRERVAYVVGDMTWAVFISPRDLEAILKEDK